MLTGLNLVTENISSSIDGLLKITNDKCWLHAKQSGNSEMSSVEEHAVLFAVSSPATKLGHKSYQCLQCRKALPSSGDWCVTDLWCSNPIICWRIATLSRASLCWEGLTYKHCESKHQQPPSGAAAAIYAQASTAEPVS